MKANILHAAVLLPLILVSCDDSTRKEMSDKAGALGKGVEKMADSTAKKVEKAADSAAEATSKATDKAAKEIEESVKKKTDPHDRFKEEP